MKNICTSIMFACLFALLAGCGSEQAVPAAPQSAPSPAAPSQPAPTKLRVALSTFTTNAPLFIAMEKGFFQEENLDVKFEFFDSSTAINVAVASKSVDVGAGGFSADLYNMIASGEKLVIVADKGKEEKGYSYSAVVVHSDSPLQSIQDLKGKKIGLTSIGSTNHYNMGLILAKHGLTTKDVEWVSMNSVSGLIEALNGKRLDVVGLSEPSVSLVTEQGVGRVLTWVSDEITPQSAGIFYSTTFAANKEAGVSFLKAYLKGARYYYDAVLTQKDGKIQQGENYQEVVKIISKYSGQPEEDMKVFPYVDPNGKMNVEDIQTQIDWYAQEQFLTGKLDVQDFVNTEYLEEALRRLEQ